MAETYIDENVTSIPDADASSRDSEQRQWLEHLAQKRRLRWRRRIYPAIVLVALVALWEIAVPVFDIKSYVAPAPSAIVQVLYAKFGMLMINLLPTAIEAVGGFVLGSTAAILIATAFVYRTSIEDAFFPIVVMINAIPIVAKAPILVLMLGNGMAPKIIIAAMICFFPTLVNMARGLRSVSSQQMELMHVLSATQSEIYFKVRVMNALPFLFSALKIAASASVVGAIVGEWIGATRGIGALIIQATYAFDSPLLYATIAVGSAFSVAFFSLVSWAERRFLRWNVSNSN
jgi:NitT/TauT family transport system permease protein